MKMETCDDCSCDTISSALVSDILFPFPLVSIQVSEPQ